MPEVRELGIGDLPPAVDITAHAMRDNPLIVAALGRDCRARWAGVQRLFTIALPAILHKGVLVGAFDGPMLEGVAGLLPPGFCQPSTFEKIAVFPRLAIAIGVDGLIRVSQWLSTWNVHDSGTPHWHLGPVAVQAQLQGHGVGHALIGECCRRLDRRGSIGYLETDKPENVQFYQEFGFQVTGKATVLGRPNWFMHRYGARIRA
jgi:GNAT superfamily N-acetyltransferase